MTERIPYTFATLRYVHDAVTEEFVNVGVVVYSPATQYLAAMLTTSYQRLVCAFGSIDGQFFRHLVRHIEDSIEEVGDHLFRGVKAAPEDLRAVLAMVLPKDDSSLQFSPVGGGLTESPGESLHSLFGRYVDKYTQREDRQSRTDQQVRSKFRAELKGRGVLDLIRQKTIRSQTFKHTFPWAWRNGIWTACEALSFDLITPDAIIGKANKWRGGVHSLRDDGSDFKVYLLLGEPSNPDLRGVYEDACAILEKIPGDHELFPEDEARFFAERAADEIRHAAQYAED